MKLNNKLKAVNDMNCLGKDRTPFVFIIDFLMQKPLVLPLIEACKEGLYYCINGETNVTDFEVVGKKIEFIKNPVPVSVYSKRFFRVMDQIRFGNTYLLNLTMPTPIETNLSLREIFIRSNAKCRLLFKDEFVVFSPESFVKIDGNVISSYPMKGTINCEIENARENILNNPKETAEHYTIVDLIRNDLNRISRFVRVDDFRYTDTVNTHKGSLLQVSSRISGLLDDLWHEKIGEIIFSMLPAGSVTGAPKEKTIDIILRTEEYDRGYYTGVFGIFDGVSLDSGVMIRFIENTSEGKIYKSGGGITAFSNLEKEYNELIDKVYVSFV